MKRSGSPAGPSGARIAVIPDHDRLELAGRQLLLGQRLQRPSQPLRALAAGADHHRDARRLRAR